MRHGMLVVLLFISVIAAIGINIIYVKRRGAEYVAGETALRRKARTRKAGGYEGAEIAFRAGRPDHGTGLPR